MTKAQNFENVFTKCRRIALKAADNPQMAFTSLNHYLDLEWLRYAFHKTRKKGAPGVDGQTWHDYELNLEENLQSLLNRAKSGAYRAPPVRRVYISKGGSTTETRPIGIPTLEDKVLQRAVLMVLEAVYKRDFYPCSYGFRRGLSAHNALDFLWQQSMKTGIQWILEVDIRKFFDKLDHRHLREFLRLRVRDGVLLRLIGKWLKAGVMEEGMVSYPDSGSPQGGVISPILANAYLHYVLDDWFHTVVLPRMKGQAFLIRYADDFVIGFTDEQDARRVTEVIPKRFDKYGLAIHPDKTRLVRFGRPQQRHASHADRPGTYDFLGFTHYWGLSLKGNWVIKRKTASNRLSRSVAKVSLWCRKNRHRPIKEQHRMLCAKLHGHYGYYGITGNSHQLSCFRTIVAEVWYKWLCRRKRKPYPTWAWFQRLLERYPLPPAIPVHSVCRVAKA
jgi:group II intron reverse transcriptase/maturase